MEETMDNNQWQSETIGAISSALAKAQGEFTTVQKTRDNPAFRSKYAGLSDDIRMVRSALSKHGLAVTQTNRPAIDDGCVYLVTQISHGESGEWIRGASTMKAAKNTPHGLGSITTYLRRYGLESILCISSDEDDDGNIASGLNGSRTEGSEGLGYPSESIIEPTEVDVLYNNLVTRLKKAKASEFEAVADECKPMLDKLRTKDIEKAEYIEKGIAKKLRGERK